MTGVLVAVLLGMSAGLLLPRSRSPVPQNNAQQNMLQNKPPQNGWAQRSRKSRGDRRSRGDRPDDLAQPRRTRPLGRLFAGRGDSLVQELPLVIHQLTGLLAAGRAPHQLWADAAALQLTALHSSVVSSGTVSSRATLTRTMQPREGEPTAGSTSEGNTLPEQLLPVLEAAAQAASLGLSPVPVFLAAAEPAGAAVWTAGGRSGRLQHHARDLRNATGRSADMALGRLWLELAACVSVSERSGAPLAGVLDRYAAQLESNLDSQAARDTALAGPLATVRLLTWLPVAGLGLGYVLGADPVGILLGTPLGWLAAAAGIILSLIGRRWSAALVRSAAGP